MSPIEQVSDVRDLRISLPCPFVLIRTFEVLNYERNISYVSTVKLKKKWHQMSCRVHILWKLCPLKKNINIQLGGKEKQSLTIELFCLSKLGGKGSKSFIHLLVGWGNCGERLRALLTGSYKIFRNNIDKKHLSRLESDLVSLQETTNKNQEPYKQIFLLLYFGVFLFSSSPTVA